VAIARGPATVEGTATRASALRRSRPLPSRSRRVIWGNRLKPGDYKYIGGFPHFVADAGEERTGRWLDEKIDLARVYGEIWKDAAPTHLIDVAVFCDSDDTHTASISYFGYVRLERR